MKPNQLFCVVACLLMAMGCKKAYESKQEISNIEISNMPEAAADMETTGPLPESETAADIPHNTEEYDHVVENIFKEAKDNPLSTFSIDVDNASYSNVRRIIESGQLPQKGAVRIEEFINYFTYNYPQPEDTDPFSITTEVWDAPWKNGHQLVRIGLQGKSPDYENLKPSNLVFLLDTSGSMESPEKLPLLREAFMLMVDNLSPGSRVSIVTYAGNAGLVLASTPVDNKSAIKAALNGLHAGGSTAGGQGLELAYKTASENFIANGNNRVILATDGDFNVGVSSRSGLMDLVQKNKGKEIFLTICGFGMGNYKDATMEQISDWGDGNYFYIDSMKEAEKVFGKELTANLFVIARDVKIQVEFNPAKIQAYRLIGYENRVLNNEDFNDDLKDAGELGAGHRVTALYEVVPVGVAYNGPSTDKLKYQEPGRVTTTSSNEMLTVKLRYKLLKSDKSLLLEKTVSTATVPWDRATADSKFVSAVAGFGMLLRDSKYKGTLDYKLVQQLAKEGMAGNGDDLKKEFLSLVNAAEALSKPGL